jgi:transcriptional regulator GlxA family with amidase domain
MAGPLIRTLIVALPETAGSALYGMVDVLCATGFVWESLTGQQAGEGIFDVAVVSTNTVPFRCGHGIPVIPDVGVGTDPTADIVILPELWLGPHESTEGRHPELLEWIRARYRAGASIYSACSGSVLLAETGLLNGCDATSHWAYEGLFRRRFPNVRFRPEPNLAFGDAGGRIVTAGGTSSWHDLALHVIARHAGAEQALRVAKVYLLKWHAEGQLPFATLVRRNPHADAVARRCEQWLSEHFREPEAVARCVAHANLPERTIKRRFKTATGSTLIERVQDLRIEHAKRLLERTDAAVDDISAQSGYEDASFFRRLFRRRVGVAPAQYRRMFAPVAQSHSPSLPARRHAARGVLADA